MSETRDVDLAVRMAEESDAETLAVLMTELGYKTRTSEMQMRLETIPGGKDPRYQGTFVAVRK